MSNLEYQRTTTSGATETTQHQNTADDWQGDIETVGCVRVREFGNPEDGWEDLPCYAKDTVMVNDGQEAWIAGTSELLDALRAIGWRETPCGESSLWTEPDCDEDTEPGEGRPYDELCWRLDPIRGSGADEQITDSDRDGPSFEWMPDRQGWLHA